MPTPAPTPAPTTAGCPCLTGDPRIELWKCGQDCFACPGRTSLTSDQICAENGCKNFYSLTQAECDNWKLLILGQTCPGGSSSGLSHFICYEGSNGFKKQCNPPGPANDPECWEECTADEVETWVPL